MKTALARFLVAFTCFAICHQALAHQFETCTDLDNRSCWHATNSSAEVASITCTGSDFQTQLAPGQLYSLQHSTAWGDGLGFPEPKTPFRCDVVLSNQNRVSVDFKTLNWGDRIHIAVSTESVSVILRESWGHRRTEVVERLWNVGQAP